MNQEQIIDLLTQAEINSIKRSIGSLFHKLLTLAEVKRALRIPSYVRSEKDTNRIVEFLQTQDML